MINLKGSRRFFFLLLLGLALASCKQQENPLGIQINLDQRELSNGLTVIMVENPSLPIISYQTWIRVGSVDEHPGITGISHLFEHLMFKGTQKYGPKEFFKQLETQGAEVNAFTTRDYTVFYENFTPPLLEKVVDMESDRLVNLQLTEESLNSERLVVLEERRLRTENNPEGQMQEALWQLAYRYHPYQSPIIGYPADLLRMTVQDLNTFYKAYYNPANVTLVIVGNFNANKTFNLITSSYGKISPQPKPTRKVISEPPQQEERRLILRNAVASEKWIHAYHISAANDDDSYALDVLASILFDGATSRAYRRLVEEKDIMIGISGSAFTPTFPGLFMVAGTMKGKIPSAKAEAEIDRLFTEVQEKPVSENEIQMAVKKLTVQLIEGIQTPYGLGQFLGTVRTVLGDPKLYFEDLRKYSEVKAPDILRVANKYFYPNNRTVVTTLPPAPAVLAKDKETQTNPKKK